ncbi:MAG: methylmalonyl Co-A mutase-associated GTPase MeaB [Myxococcota bacterium]
MSAEQTSPHALATAIRAGDRRALARGITLVESSLEAHMERAHRLLDELMPFTGHAHRIGISGTPGVGKSTLIEHLGLHLTESGGHRLAVLAVDPSSPRSGGSLLGDKTRMERLAADERAFIRPSPSRGALGGVARRTREAMLLCEAAGYDVIIIETVGVGQSESAVAQMVDTFLLLVQPGSGDELQGVKRGVLELCDVVAITKADGDLQDAAKRARLDYEHGLHLLRSGERVPVLSVSATTGQGLDELWQTLCSVHTMLAAGGALTERRAAQAEAWLWQAIADEQRRRFRAHTEVRARLEDVVTAVRNGATSPEAAAGELLAVFLGRMAGAP